ncbi:MAG: hypothetical protein V3S87_11130, partial [Alphaproteobacteria bacterium]
MATLRLATWNVNSLRLRLEQLARFAAAAPVAARYAPERQAREDGDAVIALLPPHREVGVAHLRQRRPGEEGR